MGAVLCVWVYAWRILLLRSFLATWQREIEKALLTLQVTVIILLIFHIFHLQLRNSAHYLLLLFFLPTNGTFYHRMRDNQILNSCTKEEVAGQQTYLLCLLLATVFTKLLATKKAKARMDLYFRSLTP